MLDEFKPILKFVVPAVAAVIYSVESAISDGAISSEEWKGIVVAAVVAIMVYLVPNTTPSALTSGASSSEPGEKGGST